MIVIRRSPRSCAPRPLRFVDRTPAPPAPLPAASAVDRLGRSDALSRALEASFDPALVRCLKLKFSAWSVAFLPTDAVSLSLSCLACLRQRLCNSAWAILSVRRESAASAIAVRRQPRTLSGGAWAARARWLVGNRFWWARERAVPPMGPAGRHTACIFSGFLGNQTGFLRRARGVFAPPGVQPSIGQAQRHLEFSRSAANFQSPQAARTYSITACWHCTRTLRTDAAETWRTSRSS